MTVGSGAGVCAPWFDPEGDDADTSLCTLDLSEPQQLAAATLASDILYVLTNRHWPGLCNRVVRPSFVEHEGQPCWAWWGPNPDPRAPYGWGWPWGFDVWRNMPPNRPREPGPTLRLPGPVDSITTVTIDGVALPSSAYQLVGTRTLNRIDGEDWPTSQDLTRLASSANPDGGAPAWEVAFKWGKEPPVGGALIAEVLYCEIGAGMQGGECRLMWGARLATVSRRGVNVTFESISAYLKDGLTGVDEVDAWIVAARGGPWRPRKARVLRADAPKRNSRWRT